MSDYDATADFLTSRETIEATLERDGQEFPIKFRDITLEEMEKLEALDESDEMTDAEFVGHVFDEFLVKPDLGSDDVGESTLSKSMDVLAVMMQEWQRSEEIEAALEQVDTGNRARR